MEEIIPCVYVVATPIGNISDTSPRVKHVLSNVDFIVCEDTREMKKLLTVLQINRNGRDFISLHEHNERARSSAILDRVDAGESCAYTSDAGVPAISDPGAHLVKQSHHRGIRVIPIPGPSALTAAYSVSGCEGPFNFRGFFPRSTKDKNIILEELRIARLPYVFYESPQRIRTTLEVISPSIGDRQVILCREMTKKFEQVIRGSANEVIASLDEHPKGECVLIVDGGTETSNLKDPSVQRAVQLLKGHGLRSRDLIEILSLVNDTSKNILKDYYNNS